MLNNLNLLFLTLALLGASISISSVNWFSAWMGLELNMLSFVPLIIKYKNTTSSEAAMKYFLIQASASSIFIFICIYNSYYNFMYFFFDSNSQLIVVPLMMKLGASPFHNWFIMVMQSLNWFMCYLLMTLQKLIPLFLMNLLLQNSNIILIFASMSLLVGSIGGLNQTSLNKIMAFSSINHLGWMMSASTLSKNTMILYMLFYLVTNLFTVKLLNNKSIFTFNQIMFNSSKYLNWSISILSLGGLPPFLGFIPKWMIIQLMMINNYYLMSILLIFTALITLIFYLRLIITSVIFNSFIQKWYNIKYHKNNLLEMSLTMISSLALILYNFVLT